MKLYSAIFQKPQTYPSLTCTALHQYEGHKCHKMAKILGTLYLNYHKIYVLLDFWVIAQLTPLILFCNQFSNVHCWLSITCNLNGDFLTMNFDGMPLYTCWKSSWYNYVLLFRTLTIIMIIIIGLFLLFICLFILDQLILLIWQVW